MCKVRHLQTDRFLAYLAAMDHSRWTDVSCCFSFVWLVVYLFQVMERCLKGQPRVRTPPTLREAFASRRARSCTVSLIQFIVCSI